MTAAALANAVRGGLAELADPVRAASMQAYMKSAMPFYGVPAPAVRQLCHEIYGRERLTARDDWESAIRDLFDGASYREERYAALGLAGHRFYRDYQVPASLPLYEHAIVSGAWWDLVDNVAHRVGDVLRAYRMETEPVVRQWSTGQNRWLRRTAIICQLGHRRDTDTSLLRDVIEPNMSDPDFFIRKAIGWGLREYAKTDPAWVRAFVDERRDDLSPLSVREALRHLAG